MSWLCEKDCVSCIAKFFVVVSIFYFFSVAAGLAITCGVMGDKYNMTTGYSLKYDNGTCNYHTFDERVCIMCFYDKGLALYGGCFIVGAVCNVILIIIIIFIYRMIGKICVCYGVCRIDDRWEEEHPNSMDKEQKDSLLTSSDFETDGLDPQVQVYDFDSD